MHSSGLTAPRGPILVATDFSVPARLAAARAARLAHESRSPLSLMHVLPDAPLARLRAWVGAPVAPGQPTPDDARRQLRQLARALPGAARVDTSVQDAVGSAPAAIARTAERVDAQLLVLGARGTGLLRHLVPGTTSARLVHRTDRPLLVVRQAPRAPYRRVLVAVDFSPWSATALALARRIAPQAQLVVLTAFEVPFEDKLRFAGVASATIEVHRQQARTRARQQLHALAGTAGLSAAHWSPSVVEGDAALRIVEQAQRLDCDLVVLGRRGQTGVADRLLGSVTRHVLADGQVDVLVSARLPAGAADLWEDA